MDGINELSKTIAGMPGAALLTIILLAAFALAAFAIYAVVIVAKGKQ